MFCNRCGEITGRLRCTHCGGHAVQSTTGSNVVDDGRKDPWTSTYLQRRLNPANSSPQQRPSTAHTPQATMAQDRGWTRPQNEYDLPLARPRPIRDATGPRPVSMYAGVLDGPVQSAIERTVAPKTSSGHLRPSTQEPLLRSKWSQYFTSSAQTDGARVRSESMGSPQVHNESVQNSPRHNDLVAAASAAAEAASHAQMQRQTDGQRREVYKYPAQSQPSSLQSQPNHQNNAAQHTRLGLGDAAARRAVEPKPASSMAAARHVTSAFDTRRRGPTHGTGSPLSPALDVLRSRSATLPDMHMGAERPCTTCNKQLRPAEQRQFASQPGTVYCTDCYHSSYSRGHCAGCSKIVLTHGRPWVQCGDSVWHKLCIKCRTCNKMLITPLVDLSGQPTCEPCFLKTNSRDELRPMPNDTGSKPRALTLTPQPAHTESRPEASIPTPMTDSDRAPSNVSPGAHFGYIDDPTRIMSPVEVAAKEGLPMPRHIVDPDIGAISRSESQPTVASDVRAHPPSPPVSRRSGPQSRVVSGSGLRSKLNPMVTPIDTHVMPLSPSLKNPNSPTARTASPRSVSFRIEEAPQSRMHQEYTVAEAVEPEVSEPKVAEPEIAEPEIAEPQAPLATRSLADYVLSKASTTKPKTKLPSVADTIKKFSGAGLKVHGSISQRPVERAQLPELQDMIRTHHREPPTEPTIPALNHHSKLLKSRPRNTNRRRPSHTPVTEPQATEPEAAVDPEQFVPNQCARCSSAIADTWFRLSDGRQVHVECFTCQGCEQLIDDGVYVVENNIEFHPQCVPPSPPIVSVSPVPSSAPSSRMAKPRGPRDQRQESCDRCHATLSGPRFQLTNGKSYHPECFACAGCNQRFDEGSYVCFEGQEYHHQCVDALTAPEPDVLVCGECNNHIEGVFLRHNNGVFHPKCFCCADCACAITPGMPFGEVGAKPCCESCLEARAQSAQKQEWSRQYYPAKTGY
ncbi:LIM and senescent cell antigen-like-containing domain protein 1 [Coemansia sp. RSA 1822]|nr:LIM and senescent cell antigen-like-containing domain protein 1 [Coemansia sp. RSA 1853]KAJ2561995.1 LIM and senescent cell antigen-like-containing domain protein 1 [Coemansia sp. RSA 1822]